jgi:hypothetical protein
MSRNSGLLRVRCWGAVGVLVMLGGCSSESTTDLTGAWCGKEVAVAADCVGDEVEYVELAQSGITLSGKVCEAYEKECYDIQDGAASGSHVSFFYTFSDYRVDASLDQADASTLRGSFRSSKCGCEVPLTLHRVK